MKLTLEQIKNITQGAVHLKKKSDGIRFYRFTKEQIEAYNDFPICRFTAGIKLAFKTNSTQLFIKGHSTREDAVIAYFMDCFDFFINDKLICSIDNFSDKELPSDLTGFYLPDINFSKELNLGNGDKTVEIHLPYASIGVIEEIIVDDGAKIIPIKPEKKLLAFGDSITHGSMAKHSSDRYIAKLSHSLNAEEINKAVGGDCFFPTLASIPDSFTPDYIIVAYGTNDWYSKTRNEFRINCRDFFLKLQKSYPNSKIFAITPIWRSDTNRKREFGDFSLITDDIKELTSSIKNVICITGTDLVPHKSDLFGDLSVHPNSLGFEYYYNNLYSEIKKYL